MRQTHSAAPGSAEKMELGQRRRFAGWLCSRLQLQTDTGRREQCQAAPGLPESVWQQCANRSSAAALCESVPEALYLEKLPTTFHRSRKRTCPDSEPQFRFAALLHGKSQELLPPDLCNWARRCILQAIAQSSTKRSFLKKFFRCVTSSLQSPIPSETAGDG